MGIWEFGTCALDISYRYLVEQGCIQPLCDLLTVPDAKLINVALEGLENILRMVTPLPQ